MLKKKLAKYRDSLRKAEKERYRINIRNQLLAHRSSLQNVQNVGIYSEMEGDSDNKTDNVEVRPFVDLEEEEKRKALAEIVSKWTYLTKNQYLPSYHQHESIPFFNSLLADFRKLTNYAPHLIHSQLMEESFLFLRTHLNEALQSQFSEEFDLGKQSLKNGYLEIKHHLIQAMMIVISEHFDSQGVFDSFDKTNFWQVKEFYQWLEETKKKLDQIIDYFKYSQYEEKNRILSHEIDSFQYNLSELILIVKIIHQHTQNSNLNFLSLLLEIFSPYFLKNLIQLLRNHNCPEKSQSLILSIFVLLSQCKLRDFTSVFFCSIVKFQFLEYAKLQIVFIQSYKKIKDKDKITEEIKMKINIVLDIISILSQFCYHCGSDILWYKGLCQEIKQIISQISSTQIKENIIIFLLSTVFTISDSRIIEYANKIETMEWIISILDMRVERIKDYQPEINDQVIFSCLSCLEFFVEKGREEIKQQGHPQLCTNPYLIKLKYLKGDEILGRFQEGQALLDYLFQEKGYDEISN